MEEHFGTHFTGDIRKEAKCSLKDMKIIIKADKVSLKKCRARVESPYDSRPSEPVRLVIKAMHGLTTF